MEDAQKIRERKDKYKEQQLAHRKKHTKAVLDKFSRVNKGFKLKASEFFNSHLFRNLKPMLPYITKLWITYLQVERYTVYTQNSVEMEYVFQMQIEPHLGLGVDFQHVRIYVGLTEREGQAFREGLLAIPNVSETLDKGTVKVRRSVTWLRRTEYMGNDLYDAVHKFDNELDKQDRRQDRLKEAVKSEKDLGLKERAEQSFMEMPEEIAHPNDPNRKPVQVWEVLPDEDVFANSYALVDYDVLPYAELQGEDKQERQNKAIIRNVHAEQHKGGLQSILGSLVIPETADSSSYKYFRDYQMQLTKLVEEEQCLLLIDPNSTTVTYGQISTRVQLRKAKKRKTLSHRKRHVSVRRRPPTSMELNHYRSKMAKIGKVTKPIAMEE